MTSNMTLTAISCVALACGCAPHRPTTERLDFIENADHIKYDRICGFPVTRTQGLVKQESNDPDFSPPSKFSLYRDAANSIVLIDGIGSNCSARFMTSAGPIIIDKLPVEEGGLIYGEGARFAQELEAELDELYRSCEATLDAAGARQATGNSLSPTPGSRNLELSSRCQDIVSYAITMRILTTDHGSSMLVIMGSKVFLWERS